MSSLVSILMYSKSFFINLVFTIYWLMVFWLQNLQKSVLILWIDLQTAGEPSITLLLSDCKHLLCVIRDGPKPHFSFTSITETAADTAF